jgi:hypothetical protein
MKKILLFSVIALLMVVFVGCQNKGEQAVVKEPVRKGPIVETPATAPHGISTSKEKFQVIVPDEVKKQWTKVVLIVDDRQENKTQEFTVNIGDEFKIPNSNLVVKVGPFLPDFKMSAQTITSASNDPNNPSVGVAIFEDSKQIFPTSGKWGWLYANFPTIHSFQHERYGLTLKEGIKKQ